MKLKEASLVKGEDDELENEHRMLVQHEKLYSAVEDVYKNLSEGSNGALSGLRSSLNASAEAAEIDPELDNISSRLSNAFYEIEDISETFRDYLLKDNYSPEKLAECENRLSVIHKLKKKYGGSVEEVLSFLKDSEEKLLRIENYEEDKSSLLEKSAALEKGYFEISRSCFRFQKGKRSYSWTAY